MSGFHIYITCVAVRGERSQPQRRDVYEQESERDRNTDIETARQRQRQRDRETKENEPNHKLEGDKLISTSLFAAELKSNPK